MPKKKDSPGKLIDDRFNTLEDKIEKFEKKTDERFNKVDERFNKVDERFDHLEKYIFKEVCRLDNKIDKRFEEMDIKLDKILSAVSNLVITTEGIKQGVSALSDRVRQHDDKITALKAGV